MILDTSAIIALLQAEPVADQLTVAIAQDPVRLMSVASVIESSIVLERRGGMAAVDRLDVVLAELGVEIRIVDAAHAPHARRAFRLYGKGRHPAGLNFGDCFSYALSKVTGEPLLFVGDDFSQTDVVVVDWRNAAAD